MKKIILSATILAVLIGFIGIARSQSDAGAKSDPHKVGLIDMARVFKEYRKFKVLREDLKSEIVQSDQKIKQMAARLQQLKAEAESFKAGTAEFVKREDEMTKTQAQLQAFRANAQRDFLRKESQIYKTVYLEATDVVKKYAEHYHYTLVIRFNGETLDTEDPKQLIQSLNRQVVYHRAEDDITGSVIEYLNRVYDRTNPPAKTPAAGTRNPLPREAKKGN